MVRYRCPVFWSLPLALFVLSICSCGKINGPEGGVTPTPTPEPEPELLRPKSEFFSALSAGEDLVLPFGGEWLLEYSGFSKGDVISFIDEYDNDISVSSTCTEASDTLGAVFTVPEKFIGGTCSVTVSSGGESATGKCFVEVLDDTEIEIRAGYTTYGRVVDYEGTPLPGVSVSDGVMVCVTDEEGRYYLRSSRKNEYVFVSLPKNYRAAINRGVPQFFKKFSSSVTSVMEKHNFVLAPQDQSKTRVLVWSDTHIAARPETNDVNQFRNYFKPEIRSQVEKARSENIPIYAIELGDLAWDEWWYKNDYNLSNYRKDIENLGLAIFSCPGNHDNDPEIADDFLAAASFRTNLNPAYYSFNLSDVHYIIMDNTIFNNSGGNNVQDYSEGFTDDQLKWIKADLANVPEGSKLVFGMHIQWTNRAKADGTYTFAMPATFRSELEPLLSKYDTDIISGHTHTNYTNRINENVVEHNIAAVCGTWWWTGYYSGDKCRINGDGTPSGYKILEVEGSEIDWRYKVMTRSDNYQFRAYDLRNCLITRPQYCPADKNTKVSDSFFSQYANGWDKEENTSATKKVLINVFDYSEGWSVQAFENGKELSVVRVEGYDPLHTVLFNMSRMNKNSTAMTFPTGVTSHLFELVPQELNTVILIRVSDPFGRVYEESMTRPRLLYDMSKEDKW